MEIPNWHFYSCCIALGPRSTSSASKSSENPLVRPNHVMRLAVQAQQRHLQQQRLAASSAGKTPTNAQQYHRDINTEPRGVGVLALAASLCNTKSESEEAQSLKLGAQEGNRDARRAFTPSRGVVPKLRPDQNALPKLKPDENALLKLKPDATFECGTLSSGTVATRSPSRSTLASSVSSSSMKPPPRLCSVSTTASTGSSTAARTNITYTGGVSNSTIASTASLLHQNSTSRSPMATLSGHTVPSPVVKSEGERFAKSNLSPSIDGAGSSASLQSGEGSGFCIEKKLSWSIPVAVDDPSSDTDSVSSIEIHFEQNVPKSCLRNSPRQIASQVSSPRLIASSPKAANAFSPGRRPSREEKQFEKEVKRCFGITKMDSESKSSSETLSDDDDITDLYG